MGFDDEARASTARAFRHHPQHALPHCGVTGVMKTPTRRLLTGTMAKKMFLPQSNQRPKIESTQAVEGGRVRRNPELPQGADDNR
jgi:hypothetical protein